MRTVLQKGFAFIKDTEEAAEAEDGVVIVRGQALVNVNEYLSQVLANI